MEGEFVNFVIVWFSVLLSLSYCFFIGRITHQGIPRLVCVFPVISLFLLLPLNLSSVHLGGTTAFFISWLANFKLLLFSFGTGPLSPHSSVSLKHFVASAALPIKFQNPNVQSKPNPDYKSQNKNPKFDQTSLLGYASEALLLVLLFKIYDYEDHHIVKNFRLLFYCFHIYFVLEITLATMAALVRATLGVELEPQFNKPYLSTSLQDFWGRRWNLMVTNILRPTVYEPVTGAAAHVIGRKWAQLLAILCTFLVSGLMHELMFFYLGRSGPTGEATFFFVLHGTCVAVEVAVKRTVSGRWRLPGLISGPLTAGLVLLTTFQLFVPQFLKLKVDVKAFEEYAALTARVKNFCASFHRHH